jgi:hypothetical protein
MESPSGFPIWDRFNPSGFDYIPLHYLGRMTVSGVKYRLSNYWPTLRKNYMKSRITLKSLLFPATVIVGIGLLLPLTTGFPAAAQVDLLAPPLTYQVLENSEIVIRDGENEVCHILPFIASGKASGAAGGFNHFDKIYGLKSGSQAGVERGFDVAAQVDGLLVDVRVLADPFENGLHIRYVLKPRETVVVSRVNIATYFKYAEWQGAQYRLGSAMGVIPDRTASVGVIRQADSAPLSMGPSFLHGGLAVEMSSDDLNLLFGNNWYDRPALSVIYAQDDSKLNASCDWNWWLSGVKTFNFTLTFNRHVDPTPLGQANYKTIPLAPTPTIQVQPSTAEKMDAIEFTDPPALVYVTFGDGPGRYQVEVADSGDHIFKEIFNRQIVTRSDTWLEWDGLDGKGQPVPLGRYYVFIYKDAKPLKRITLVRVPKPPK